MAVVLLHHGFFMREDVPARSGDMLNWEILIRGEAEGIGVLARSRKWLETELARESDGVGGIEAEGPYDAPREIDKEDVRRYSLHVTVGAGPHPRRATMIALSEGTTG